MTQYPRQPLKHLAAVSVSNVDKKAVEGDRPVRLVNYTDVYYSDRITPTLPLMDATATTQQLEAFRVRPGDVAITKDSETADDIGIAAFIEESAPDLVLGYHLALLSPRRSIIDPRFLYWSMRSDLARGQLSTGATGVTRFGLRQDVIASVALPTPALATQRAIADFLDTETARIDALITKKRHMIDLVSQKLHAERDRVVWSGSPPTAPLRHLTRSDRPIMYGIVLPGPDVEEGVPIVKGGDVAAGFARPLCRTTHEIESRYIRSRLRAADLVFAIRGGVGDVALVPPDVAGANITQDVARIAPDASVEPRWLRHVLQSPAVQSEAAERTTGATIRGLNIEALKLIRVPWIGQALQRAQADDLDAIEMAVGMLTSKLRKQIALLQEHRQALITAAVTGELGVPGMAA